MMTYTDGIAEALTALRAINDRIAVIQAHADDYGAGGDRSLAEHAHEVVRTAILSVGGAPDRDRVAALHIEQIGALLMSAGALMRDALDAQERGAP